MPAAATDKFRKSYSFLTKSLSSNVDSSTTTIPLNNTTNVPTDTAVDFIIDRVDTNGTRTPTTRELCSGVVSGSNIVSVTRGLHGTTAQSHTSGAVVEFVNSGAAWNDLMDGILVAHDQDGTLKAGAVDAAAVLASDVVTTAKILDDAVTAPKLSGIDRSNLTTDSNPYKFSVYNNANQTVSTGSNQKLSFNTEIFDTNSNFSSGTYTAPVDGFYEFAGAATSNSTAYIIVFLYVNGNQLFQGVRNYTGTGNGSSTLSVPFLQLNAGNTVELYVYSDTATIQGDATGKTWFMGGLKCRT